MINPLANLITCTRIALSLALLFCRALSIPFFIIYVMAGITDMIDGSVARKTGAVSEFGSKLDTIADFALVAVCVIKILPLLNIETWMLVWTAIIAFIKAINIVSGLVVQKKMVVVHSALNKATGVLLFVLPLSLNFVDLQYSATIVCIMATIAAMQEGHLIRTQKIEENEKEKRKEHFIQENSKCHSGS